MSMYPEYMIALDNPKFPNVYAQWAVNVMLAMGNRAPTEDFLDRIEFYLGTHNECHVQSVKADLKKMVSKYRDSEVQSVVLCYDSTMFNIERLWLITRHIMAQKRQKDYQIQIISAFNFTNNLDNSLLDYCLPDINLLFVTFTHPRSCL